MASLHPITYNGILSKLRRLRYDTCKIGYNTYARLEDNKIIVKYHNTDIIELTENTVKFNAANWLTSTTKDRLNQFMPDNFRIYQKDYIWYIWNYKTQDEYIFQNNCQYDYDNNSWHGLGNIKLIKRQKRLQNKLKLYAKKFISSVFSGKHDFNTSGDCLYCQFREVNSKIPIGELNDDNNHILSHIKEDYFVTSLLYRSIELYDVSMVAKWTLQDLINGGNENLKDTFGEIAKDQIYKSLVKYLSSQLRVA